jgi:hypothetical protein
VADGATTSTAPSEEAVETADPSRDGASNSVEGTGATRQAAAVDPGTGTSGGSRIALVVLGVLLVASMGWALVLRRRRTS